MVVAASRTRSRASSVAPTWESAARSASVPTCLPVRRAARWLALTASRVSFLACVRTRVAPVRVGVVRAVLRRAAGLRLRAAGFFAAAGLGLEVVVVLVVSDIDAPVPGFPLKAVF